MKKRVFTMLMVLVMLASLMAVPAMAADDHVHYDREGNKVCDVANCGAEVIAKHRETLTITNLQGPSEGVAVDFTATVAEEGYGPVTVKWQRMTKADGSDAVNMASTNTYAAGCMYTGEIWVVLNRWDTVASPVVVSLNGTNVPFYTTAAAYNNAGATYEGVNNVYRAREIETGGVRYLVVSVQVAKLGGTHVCAFGSDWISNGTQHYLMCTGCGATKDTAKHADGNANGLCDACGFEMGSAATGNNGTAAHTHSYGSDWVEDNANHWKQCTGCGATTQTAKHADLNSTGKCDVCGFVMTAAAGHTHSYSSEWTETFAQHFKVCSCGAKSEIAAHFDNNKSGLCDVCGYTMTSASNGGNAVPPTGDNNSAFLWAATLLVSVMGLVGTAVVAVKRREE